MTEWPNQFGDTAIFLPLPRVLAVASLETSFGACLQPGLHKQRSSTW